MPTPMKALKTFRYAGGQYKSGDIFQCRERDLKLIIAAKLGVEVDPSKVVPTYQTRHLVADMSVPQLRNNLEESGVTLPKKYITKAELLLIHAREGLK